VKPGSDADPEAGSHHILLTRLVAQQACESSLIPTLDNIRGMSIAYITVIHRVQVDKAMSVMLIPTGFGNEKRIEHGRIL